jgi:hypothetical protein
VTLDFAGAVLDLGVTDLSRAEDFYAVLLGRGPDFLLSADDLTFALWRQWHLHRDPEVAFRITADLAYAGHGRLARGVVKLAAERSRLLRQWLDLPGASEMPGVIMLLRVHDLDSSEVTHWQDLLRSGHA